MTYDLKAIEAICLKNQLKCAFISDYEIEVFVASDSILIFANTVEGNDNYLGFRGMPWHSHEKLILMTGDSTYVEYGPSELLSNIISGHVMIVTQYGNGVIKDKWLAHRDERMDIRYIEPDEELRIYRTPEPGISSLNET